jgi:hypothetical protein
MGVAVLLQDMHTRDDGVHKSGWFPKDGESKTLPGLWFIGEIPLPDCSFLGTLTEIRKRHTVCLCADCVFPAILQDELEVGWVVRI